MEISILRKILDLKFLFLSSYYVSFDRYAPKHQGKFHVRKNLHGKKPDSEEISVCDCNKYNL